jgi:hypothetical protein
LHARGSRIALIPQIAIAAAGLQCAVADMAESPIFQAQNAISNLRRKRPMRMHRALARFKFDSDKW